MTMAAVYVSREHYNALTERAEKQRALLERCRTILGNMAREEEWAMSFRRWPIHHEPLRHDARNLLPELDAALDPAALALEPSA